MKHLKLLSRSLFVAFVMLSSILTSVAQTSGTIDDIRLGDPTCNDSISFTIEGSVDEGVEVVTVVLNEFETRIIEIEVPGFFDASLTIDVFADNATIEVFIGDDAEAALTTSYACEEGEWVPAETPPPPPPPPPPGVFELVLNPTTSLVSIGSQQTLSVSIANPNLAPTGAIRGLDISCSVDNTTLLSGVQLQTGTAFLANGTAAILPVPDFNPSPNFHWLVSIPESEQGVSSDGLALSATYQALAAGTATISCVADAIDNDSNLIENVAINTAVIEVVANPTISGTVTLEHGTDYSNITVNLTNDLDQVVASTTTDADGNFAFTNVAPGDYTIAADAAGYVAISEPLSVVLGSDVNLSGTLTSGDVNNDNVVDLLDVTHNLPQITQMHPLPLLILTVIAF